MVFRPRLNKEQKDIIPVPSSGATPEEWLNKFHRASGVGGAPITGSSLCYDPDRIYTMMRIVLAS